MKKPLNLFFIFMLCLCMLPINIQAAEKVENTSKLNSTDVIISNQDYYGSTDITNASKYFYEYTGLHLYFVYWCGYTYDDNYDRVSLYDTEKEWKDAVYTIADQIEDDYKVVIVDGSPSKNSWSYITDVVYGTVAEEIFSLDDQTILNYILTNPRCVVEDYNIDTYRTVAIKKIVPLLMQNELDLDTFMTDYYYGWDDTDYDSPFYVMLGFIYLYGLPIFVVIAIILAIIFIRLAIVHKHGYKNVEEIKAQNESKELDKQILDTHLEDYADELADKYTRN